MLWNKIQINVIGLILVLASAGLAEDDLGSRVAFEGGLLNPLGELGAGFDGASLGLGADTGYELGFRVRLPLTSVLSVSPGFHFADFKSHVLTEDEQEYQTEALSYRFTLEGMLKQSEGDGWLRPFLAVAAGLYRDRIVGYYDDPLADVKDSSVNSFGYSVRVGLATNAFELSCVVHRNRVETWRFFEMGFKESYRWDNVGVRLGYLLPY